MCEAKPRNPVTRPQQVLLSRPNIQSLSSNRAKSAFDGVPLSNFIWPTIRIGVVKDRAVRSRINSLVA